ncbi:hypothetical protein D3C87_1948450 [compost metagenome]
MEYAVAAAERLGERGLVAAVRDAPVQFKTARQRQRLGGAPHRYDLEPAAKMQHFDRPVADKASRPENGHALHQRLPAASNSARAASAGASQGRCIGMRSA